MKKLWVLQLFEGELKLWLDEGADVELAAKAVGVTFWGAEVVLMTAWLKLAEKTVGVTI